MKAAILDIDSKIPNLALMKIATSLRNYGIEFDFFRFGTTAYPRKTKRKDIVFDGTGYDKVYASIIFTTNRDILKVVNCDNVEIGGSGYDLKKKLSDGIEGLAPDYSLYPGNDTAYGFITRGCIRNCYFCFVPRKEGKLFWVRSPEAIASIWYKKVVFMDNNVLAYPTHKEVLQRVIDLGVKLTFNQGLDIRLVDDENAKLLSQMRYTGEYIFAFDDIASKDKVEEKYTIVKKYIPADWKIKFFIYCHPTKTTMRDIRQRIEWCYNNKALPYIMRDFDCYTDKHSGFYTDLASWCNQPGIFKNMTFRQFLRKRVNTKKREATSKAIYYVFCN